MNRFRWPMLWIGLAIATPPALAQDDAPMLAEGEVLAVIGEAEQAFDLAECIARAMDANPALQRERTVMDQLTAQVTQAKATGYPSLDLKSSWSRGRDPSFALDESFGGGGDLPDSSFAFVLAPEDIPAQSFWRSSLESVWTIQPIRFMRALSTAGKAIERQRLDLSDIENRTVEDVVRAYHEVILAREELLAIDAELVAREELLAISRRRFALDLDAPLDTLQAAVTVANLRPQRSSQRQRLRAAGRALNLLLGRDALAPIAIAVQHGVEDTPVPAEHALRLAQRRPDLQSARMQATVLRGRRGVLRADNHPFFTLEGSFGYVGKEFDSQFDEGQDTWRAAVTFNWPLWDGLRKKGEIRETEADIRRQEFLASELESVARAEVLDALDALGVARQNLDAAELNLRMADDAHRQTTLRYELGTASFVEVLNAQTQRFTARSNLVRARYEVLSSSATLKRAMGRSPIESFASILTLASSEDL